VPGAAVCMIGDVGGDAPARTYAVQS